jgi:biotin operon repressor|nr:MAG TPA: replisome organizer [Caudoviricetes sp.]
MADIEGGYIKLYRKMTKWQWYSDEVMFRVFMHLLLTANYEPAYWRDVKIERGQTVVSLAKLGATLNYSKDTVLKALKRLESSGEITRRPTARYTIVTISNYNEYQDKPTDNRPPTDRQPTADRPMTDRRVDPLKEVKKNKEEKEEKEAVRSASGSQEQNLIDLYGIEATEKYKKRFYDWAEKRGKQNLDCITIIAKWMEQDNVPRKKAEVNDGGTHTNFRPSEW